VKLDGTVNNKGTKVVKGASVQIEQGDLYFKPTFLKAKAGSTVKVTVKNEGDTDHTFTIDGQSIDESLSPGDSAKVAVTIPSNGKPVPFYCRFHVSSGMQGAFFTNSGGAAQSTGGSSGGSSGY
jgi:plastocyanin